MFTRKSLREGPKTIQMMIGLVIGSLAIGCHRRSDASDSSVQMHPRAQSAASAVAGSQNGKGAPNGGSSSKLSQLLSDPTIEKSTVYKLARDASGRKIAEIEVQSQGRKELLRVTLSQPADRGLADPIQGMIIQYGQESATAKGSVSQGGKAQNLEIFCTSMQCRLAKNSFTNAGDLVRVVQILGISLKKMMRHSAAQGSASKRAFLTNTTQLRGESEQMLMMMGIIIAIVAGGAAMILCYLALRRVEFVRQFTRWLLHDANPEERAAAGATTPAQIPVLESVLLAIISNPGDEPDVYSISSPVPSGTTPMAGLSQAVEVIVSSSLPPAVPQ